MNLYATPGIDFQLQEKPKEQQPSSSGLVPPKNRLGSSLSPATKDKKKSVIIFKMRQEARKKKLHKATNNAVPKPMCFKPESTEATITDEELEEVDVTTFPVPIKEEREVEIIDVEDVKPTFATEVLKNITACLEYFPMCCATEKEIFQRVKYNFEDITLEVVSEIIRIYGSSCLLKIEINNVTLWSSICRTDGLNVGRIVGGYIQCIKNAMRLLKTPISCCGTSKEIYNRFAKLFDSLGCIDFTTIDNLLTAYTGSHFQVTNIGNIRVYFL